MWNDVPKLPETSLDPKPKDHQLVQKYVLLISYLTHTTRAAGSHFRAADHMGSQLKRDEDGDWIWVKSFTKP